MITYNNDVSYPQCRDINHLEQLSTLLKRVKEQYPDMRVGQIITNTIRCFGFPSDHVFVVEDSSLVVMLGHVVEHGFIPARFDN